jgi:phage gpG-like protein
MLTAQVDLRDVLTGLEAMKAKGMDLRPVWKAMRKVIGADLRQHARDQAGPNGAWAGRAASTIERVRQSRGAARRRRKRWKGRGLKATSHARPVRLLGKLPTAFDFTSSPSEIVGVSKVPWADVHQTGGTAGRGSRIPARPFAYLSDRVVQAGAEAVRAYVQGAW